MKIGTLLLISACFATLTHAAWSQSQPHATLPGRLGYIDAKTGAFVPLPVVPDDGATPAVTPTTGKFVFNLTINIKSVNIRADVFSCLATAGVSDNITGVYTSSVEEASVAATVTGSTATCTVSIPYSWTLLTPGADVVTLTLQLNAFGVGTTQPTRLVEQTLPHINVPLNGATTTYTKTLTM